MSELTQSITESKHADTDRDEHTEEEEEILFCHNIIGLGGVTG